MKHLNEIYWFCSFIPGEKYVEDTTTSPIGYIECIYGKSGYKKLGVGRKLVPQGEKWNKQMRCTQIASDAKLNNKNSITFHHRAGFNEVNRLVCFVKQI